MKDLILHIERLLPEHDCIVVPGLGGFVQNETEARLLHNKETFYPRGKETSFNARLTFNDGILVQSYQEVCEISFEEAVERVREEVREIHLMLDEGKFVRFGRIGTIHKTDQGSLQFRPDNRNLFYPESYGLMPFVYPNLENRSRKPVKAVPKKRREDTFIHIRLSKRSFQNFLTGAAASLLVLLISKPAGNIENVENQKAFLLQEYIMAEPGNDGILVEPVAAESVISKPVQAEKTIVNPGPGNLLVAKPAVTMEVAPGSAEKSIAVSGSKVNLRTYYIIISSFPVRTGAERWLTTNKKGFYNNAGIIEGDGRSRIYINQFHNKQLAESWLNKFRTDNPSHGDAWLLSVKN